MSLTVPLCGAISQVLLRSWELRGVGAWPASPRSPAGTRASPDTRDGSLVCS